MGIELGLGKENGKFVHPSKSYKFVTIPKPKKSEIYALFDRVSAAKSGIKTYKNPNLRIKMKISAFFQLGQT